MSIDSVPEAPYAMTLCGHCKEYCFRRECGKDFDVGIICMTCRKERYEAQVAAMERARAWRRYGKNADR